MKIPSKAPNRAVAAFCMAMVLAVAGCANFATQPTPTTFNGRLLAADGLATAIGQTCLDLSKRSRLSIEALVRCTKTVEQAGSLVDTARTVGSGAGEDRLAAAQTLLLALEADLKARETK